MKTLITALSDNINPSRGRGIRDGQGLGGVAASSEGKMPAGLIL